MKFPFWATLFTLFGIIILCGLGVWQFERLVWKRQIINQIDKEYSVNAEFVPLTPEDFKVKEGYKRGFIDGTFLHEYEIHVSPRMHDGKLGYHVITPFSITGFEAPVLVNRGWVPVDHEMPEGKNVSRSPEKVRITGILKVPADKNMFTPANDPAKGLWFSLSPSEILMFYKLNGINGRVLYQEGEDLGTYPVPQNVKLALSNNHAFYAVFWFLMAFALGAVYWTRFFGEVLKAKKSKVLTETGVD